MRITNIKILNLHSYVDAELQLEDYNVVVGHNASGKTNILRIFDLLGGINEELPLRYPTEEIKLPLESRFDHEQRSSLSVDLTLSELEARLLLQSILHRDIVKISDENLRQIRMVISWPVTVEESTRPDFVLVRLGNGISIVRTGHREVTLSYMNKLAGGVDELRSKIGNLKDANLIASNYQGSFGFPPASILSDSNFQSLLLSGGKISQYFRSGKDQLALRCVIEEIEYRAQPGAPSHVAEIVKYCNPTLPTAWSVTAWLLLRTFLNHDFSILRDIPVNYTELANKLYVLEKTGIDDQRFEAVCKGFSRLFINVKFKVVQPDPKIPQYRVKIIEPRHTAYLEDSASGYYEALRIFSESIFTKDNIVLLDEPALHLHPIKIKLLARILAEFSNNQVIVITHSPYFVDTYLFSAGRNLMHVKKDSNGRSEIFGRDKNFNPQIKSHLFEPEIFFSRFNIFVEGPGDLSALIAISDYFNSIFETNDILVVYIEGYGYVDNYYDLISAYHLPSIFMVDSEYRGKAKGVIKLDKKLEYELKKIGWKGNVSSSANPAEVYDFIFNAMQKNRKKVRGTKLARAFNAAVKQTGTDFNKLWKKKIGANLSSLNVC